MAHERARGPQCSAHHVLVFQHWRESRSLDLCHPQARSGIHCRTGYGPYDLLPQPLFHLSRAGTRALCPATQAIVVRSGWLLAGVIVYLCVMGFIVLTTYLVAKRISGGDPRIAGLALCSFLFIPQFSYESHRDLTHSVLACTLAAVEIYLLLKLVEGRRLLHYALFGAVAGLGL